jgi:hypothetical protein
MFQFSYVIRNWFTFTKQREAKSVLCKDSLIITKEDIDKEI